MLKTIIGQHSREKNTKISVLGTEVHAMNREQHEVFGTDVHTMNSEQHEGVLARKLASPSQVGCPCNLTLSPCRHPVISPYLHAASATGRDPSCLDRIAQVGRKERGVLLGWLLAGGELKLLLVLRDTLIKVGQTR